MPDIMILRFHQAITGQEQYWTGGDRSLCLKAAALAYEHQDELSDLADRYQFCRLLQAGKIREAVDLWRDQAEDATLEFIKDVPALLWTALPTDIQADLPQQIAALQPEADMLLHERQQQAALDAELFRQDQHAEGIGLEIHSELLAEEPPDFPVETPEDTPRLPDENKMENNQ